MCAVTEEQLTRRWLPLLKGGGGVEACKTITVRILTSPTRRTLAASSLRTGARTAHIGYKLAFWPNPPRHQHTRLRNQRDQGVQPLTVVTRLARLSDRRLLALTEALGCPCGIIARLTGLCDAPYPSSRLGTEAAVT